MFKIGQLVSLDELDKFDSNLIYKIKNPVYKDGEVTGGEYVGCILANENELLKSGGNNYVIIEKSKRLS